MKKVLLGTTALIGALATSSAVLADDHMHSDADAPITVRVGGAVRFIAGYVDEDITGANADSARDYAADIDASAFISAEGVAANGIVYGAKAELLPDASDEEEHNEYFVYASGTFGTVEAGQVGGTLDRLSVVAPREFGTGGADGEYEDFQAQTIGGFNTGEGIDNLSALDENFNAFDSHDDLKINYFSPSFSGFQFGLSFTPDGDDTGNSGNQGGDRTLRSDVGTQAANTLNGVLSKSGFENFYEVALNYNTQFSGVGVAIGGGYSAADAKEITGASYEDLSAYQAGLQLSYMGFVLGGGYVNNGDSGYLATGANDDDNEAYNFGIQYVAGPVTVGANALLAENEGFSGTAGNNELDVYSVGTSYRAAPGWTAFVEASMFEAKYDTAAGGTIENDGSVVMVGTAIEF